MKLAALGDLHLRTTIPRGRSDLYNDVLIDKFKFILDFCDEHKIEYLIQPGDFFHEAPEKLPSVIVSINLFIKTINLLQTHKVKVLLVYGQHDLRFHAKDTSNTPIRLLESLSLVTRLTPVAPVVIGWQRGIDKVAIWGSSWKEEIPKDLYANCTNIWATHRMVTDSDKLWPGAKDYSLAKHLLRANRFQLIVTGDNHKAFITNFATRWLANCGSLGRTNIDQASHIPCFIVFDTKTRKLIKVRVPIRPPKEVLKVEEAEAQEQKKVELAEFYQTKCLDFIEELKSARTHKGVNYKAVVMDALRKIDDDHLTYVMKNIFAAAETKDMKMDMEKANDLG